MNRKLLTILTATMISLTISIILWSEMSSTLARSATLSQQARQYDPHADINDDGKIDMRDLGAVARLFGTTGDPWNMTEFNNTLLMMENDFYKSGRLVRLPFAAYEWPGDSASPDTGTILYSIDLDQNQPGDQQSIFAYKGTTINVTGEYQIFQSTNVSGAIMQAFFIYSWTPSWPVPNSTFYRPIYEGSPGAYPGTGRQSFSFNLTVPDIIGVYYLYWCVNAQYSMDQAVSMVSSPLHVPYAVILVGW